MHDIRYSYHLFFAVHLGSLFSCLILMSPASHLKNPALQDSYHIFNQDCELVSQLPIFYITVTIQHPHSQNRSFRASLLLMWLLFSSIHPTAVRTLPYLPPVPPDTSLRYLLQGIRKFRREVPSVCSGMPWTGRLPVPNR